MGGVLVVAEARRGELRDVSLELITAGAAIKDAAGGRLAVAIVADDPSAFTDALGADGVDEVLTVRSPRSDFEAHLAQKALTALIEAEQPSVVLLGHTIDSLGYAPAVAAIGGYGYASDITGLSFDGAVAATRGAYGDKLAAELEFPGKDVVLLTVRAGAFEQATGSGGASVREVDAGLGDGDARTEHVEYREAAVGDVDITKADFLLSIGRGVEDKDNIPQFAELADLAGATLSVSRPIVDAGWMPSARQVGQSGKTVKPKVYLALGISGAVQHLAGMSKAETIIAVNTDPEAPIFGVAHYGAVADMFDVAEALEQVYSS